MKPLLLDVKYNSKSYFYSGIFKQRVQRKDMVCMKDLTGCQMSWQNRNDKIGTTIIAMVLLYLIIS